MSNLTSSVILTLSVANWNLANYQSNLGVFLKFLADRSSGLGNLVEEFMHESGHTEQDIIRMQNKYIGTHQAEQDLHGALGWIMKQLLTRMVKKVDNMEIFRKSLLQNTGYTLEELENSYKRVAEFIESKRKTLSP